MKKIVLILTLLLSNLSFSQSLTELVTKGDSCISAKNPSMALQFYSRAIERDSKCSMCYYKRGSLYAKEGYNTEAIHDLNYTSLLRVSQKDEVLENTFFLLGSCYDELNDAEKAINNYTNSLLVNPKNLKALEARFYTLITLHKNDEALKDLKRFQKFSKEKAKIQFLYAKYYSATNQKEKANKALTKAILKKPTEVIYYLERGKLLVEQEKYEDAIVNFSKAIELDQDNDQAYLQRGMTYHKVNNSMAGCSDFRRAVILGSDEARVMLEAHCPH